MSTEKRLNIGYDSAVDDRGARFCIHINGVQFNENKLTYVREGRAWKANHFLLH